MVGVCLGQITPEFCGLCCVEAAKDEFVRSGSMGGDLLYRTDCNKGGGDDDDDTGTEVSLRMAERGGRSFRFWDDIDMTVPGLETFVCIPRYFGQVPLFS